MINNIYFYDLFLTRKNNLSLSNSKSKALPGNIFQWWNVHCGNALPLVASLNSFVKPVDFVVSKVTRLYKRL